MITDQFDAVLFDLDATLIDSTESVVRSWRRWAEEFAVVLPTELEHGLPAGVQVARYLPPERIAAGIERIGQLELADTDGIVALPGVADALAAIPGHRCAIVTSCTAELAAARMAAAGIRSPAVLVTVDRLSRGKPDPEGYLLAAHELGFEPTRCLAVEDAPGGLAAATAAGCTTLALTTTTPRRLLAADLVVASLEDVWFQSVPGGGVLVTPRQPGQQPA